MCVRAFMRALMLVKMSHPLASFPIMDCCMAACWHIIRVVGRQGMLSFAPAPRRFVANNVLTMCCLIRMLCYQCCCCCCFCCRCYLLFLLFNGMEIFSRSDSNNKLVAWQVCQCGRQPRATSTFAPACNCWPPHRQLLTYACIYARM